MGSAGFGVVQEETSSNEGARIESRDLTSNESIKISDRYGTGQKDWWLGVYIYHRRFAG